MPSDYHIEDLVFQNEKRVVYRVRTPDGTPLAIVRLRYEEDILEKLKENRFEHALEELKSLSHSCLRPVLDGGLDPVDSSPWVAVRWWEGALLTDRIKQGPILTQEEFDRIKDHGSNLIETLGPVASTVSFKPSSVITCGTDPAKLIDTFAVDYHAWFHAFAKDVHPSTLSASYQKLSDLLTFLRRHTQHTPATLVTSDLAASTHRSTLTHAPSALSNPSSTVALPSSSKSSLPVKSLLFVSTLLIGIGTCFWFITQKKDSQAEPLTVIADSSSSKPKKSTQPSLIDRSPTRPDRPRLDLGHEKVDPSDPKSIKQNIGKWVRISGNIDGLDAEGRLIFEKSSLLVSLPPASQTTAENAIGNAVTIQGFLESANLLDVEDQTDVNISYLLKDIYSLKDEAQLRGMKSGQIVTLQGKIVDQTSSSSGKTLYLQLKNEKPEFTFSVQVSKAESSLTKAYLRSLIEKTISVKGPIKLDTRGSRLSVVITKKAQINIVE